MNLENPNHLSYVLSGEMQVGQGAQVLTALLGSCVGIGMIWREQGRCGLAHCFLPDGPEQCATSARYVSAAVPRLLALLGVRHWQYEQVEVVIAGGGRMLNLHALDGAVGTRNIEAARAQLSLLGLNVTFEDVGGWQGRRLSIDCDRQSFSVVRIARAAQAVAA